jgi:uncharacterized protein
MMRTALYDTTPARGWLPWTWLAPILCLAFAIATEFPADIVLKHLGLQDAQGDLIGAYGLLGLLLVSFVPWGALVLVWVMGVERRSLATIGMARPGLRSLLAGLAIGVATISLVVAMIALAGGYRTGRVLAAFDDGRALVAITLLLPGFVIQSGIEEIIFRGWLLSGIARRRSLVVAIGVSTALFTLMHYSPGQAPLATANVVLFGLFACAWSVATNSIWGAMGWHAGWNWLLATGFELPVTGIDADLPALLVAFQPIGSEVLTGGEHGPEASALCTLFFVIGIVFCVWRGGRWCRVARPAERANDAPA